MDEDEFLGGHAARLAVGTDDAADPLVEGVV